ncbi:Transcriptional adapter 2 [Ceratocystis fimbriata CBS 114723]|uniref:Transcriptional adapter 2 n=1 Tax=Ceratocystis fimbriata CBS 114723 TaxID=1035309 RepID=A0A2C5WDA6_9PEZI|nr:Transcriptional adapter 2 [Ceratocystis fimbriata CBS 114723]
MGVIRKKTAVRGGEGGVKYVCDVCSVDITSTVRIRCAHSACNEYDLCVQCFAKGESSDSHKPESHPYRVIEQNSFPIFSEDWGADEELLLLEGCETYGLGSWADIADHIGGYRTKDEVREHYLTVYIDSPRFPLPKRCSPYDNELATRVSREEFQARKKRRIEDRRNEAKAAAAPLPKTKPTASVPSCHEIQGYMPGRLEFETEYANEAEEAVQSMQFDPGDGFNPRTGELEPEMDLKLTVMDIYNNRLTQRVQRKKVIFEHNLLDYRENIKLEKKRTKEEKDLLLKAKPFARMMNHNDYENFCQGLLDELNMRQAIAQLQEWRSMRIGDLKSGEKFEVEKQQRIQKATPMGSMDRDRLAGLQRTKGQPPPEPPSGAALLIAPEMPARMSLPPAGTGRKAAELADNQAALANGDAVDSHSNANANGANGVANGSAANGAPNGTASHGAPNGAPAINGTATMAPRLKYVAPPISGMQALSLTHENAPDLHLLTPEEVKLCEVIRMQPKPYLMAKEQLLKEALKGNGMLKKKQAKEIVHLDSQKVGRIFDLMIHSGWIGKA